MRFRVDKNLSEKQLNALILEQAKLYCTEVLKTGSMSGASLGIQRVLIQYYEALEEKKEESDVLPGQIGMFP